MTEHYADPTVAPPLTPYERKMAGRAARGDHTRIPMALDPTERRMRGVAAHGHTPFDVPFVSQIDGNLWQGGCQDGLILPDFIEHVVSLYPWEQYTVRHELKSSLTVRMYDDIGQSMALVDHVARWVLACVEDGPTLVHCQAGLNRSSLIAARALTLGVGSFGGGINGEQAIALIRARRSPACLCNPAFEAAVRGWS